MDPKKPDPYKGLKHIGYCLSQFPEGYRTKKQFIQYAKFKLARRSKRLLKDPIWDSYTEEELLMEYFANLFEDSKDFLMEFEAVLRGDSPEMDEFDKWAEAEMGKQAKKLDELKENVSFDPSTMGE